MAKEQETESERDNLLAEAKTLGVTRSKVKTTSFTVRGKTPGPEVLAKETEKHEKLADKRLKIRVKEAKQRAKQKPIDKRKDLLKSRFRAVRNRTRANTYSDKNIKAWLEELNLIQNNPKSWVKQTNNGKNPFIPSNRKKKTAKEILDGMDLD